MYKYILCDLFDVLIKGLEGSEYKIAEELGIDVETVSKQLYSFDFRDFWIGKISEDKFFSNLIKSLEWNISVERLKSIVRNNFKEIEGVKNIYQDLKKSYKLILLTVISPEWVEYVNSRYNLKEIFDYVYCSYDIGFTKREPESYLYILNKHKIQPSEVFLIDDSTRNGLVAESVGIKSLKFINIHKLKQDLKALINF